MPICCVINCFSNPNDMKKFTKFSFPRDPELREKWAEAIPLKYNISTKKLYVCEKHFVESDLILHWQPGNDATMINKVPYKKPKLQKNAVPSVFPKSKYSKEIQKRILLILPEDVTTNSNKILWIENNYRNIDTVPMSAKTKVVINNYTPIKLNN